VPIGLLFNAYRGVSALILIILQLIILLTGNFGFFNFLIIAILIPLLFINKKDFNVSIVAKKELFLIVPISFIVCLFSLFIFVPNSPLKENVPKVFNRLFLFNQYGVFARMTTNQTRVIAFVSYNNINWQRLNLKYYDDNGFPDLSFIQPHMPRIRWQLWFYFLQPHRIPHWFNKFILEITKNPNSLKSIVQINHKLQTNYRYFHLCTQDIAFDLDNDLNDESKYWHTLSELNCKTFDTKK
jgi:Protein of unknown function (DUF1222).